MGGSLRYEPILAENPQEGAAEKLLGSRFIVELAKQRGEGRDEPEDQDLAT
jgi:hypothetical protein